MFHAPVLSCDADQGACMFTDCRHNRSTRKNKSIQKGRAIPRFQAHLARYCAPSSKRAEAGAGKKGFKSKKEGVEDPSHELFRNGIYM